MVETAPIRLSSRLTLFHKLIFPTAWIFGFACATLAMFMRPDARAQGSAVFFAAITLTGTLVLSARCFPLKTVIAGEDGIVVSNFIRQIHIPYDQIVSVHENRWFNPRDMTIWLRADSGFGQKITFEPYVWFTFRFRKDHPAVELLRERINRAQSMSQCTG